MTLFRYVLGEFFKYVIATLIFALFLFVLFDAVHRATRFYAVHNAQTKDIISFYIYQMPLLVSQALPIAALIGSVTCMLILSRSNEITAMRAAGMGPIRVGLPIAVGGILLSFSETYLSEMVVPQSSAKMHYIREVVIEGESDHRLVERTKWLKLENRFFHFDHFDPLEDLLHGFKMVEVGDHFKPKTLVNGKIGKFDPKLQAWKISDVLKTKLDQNGKIREQVRLDSIMSDIPLNYSHLKRERRDTREMSLRELNAMIKSGLRTGVDVTPYRADYHVKLALHFAAFVVCLIGIKFAYQSERKVESAGNIMLALSIGLGYWFILGAARTYAAKGTIDPIFAAWLANTFVAVAALSQIWSTQRRS